VPHGQANDIGHRAGPFCVVLLNPCVLIESEFEQQKARYLAGLERQKKSPELKVGQFFLMLFCYAGVMLCQTR